MDFVVTARKWRPQKFDDVVGQEHITTTLKNAIKNNRIAHAYIFTGPRGVGKTTTARILAKTLNCLNSIDNEPCNDCEMCRSISNSQSLDIIEIDGASNRGIDEIRSLRDSVKYAPTKGKYKVYIIDEVHMLTKESFNAFLKTLEEPPSHTIFIFATTDIHKVPLTIISRCQRFDFRRIQLETIKTLLRKIADKEKINIDDKTLTIISKKADGALRDAESFFDQIVSFCGNSIDSDTVSQMLNLIDDELYFVISDAVLNKNFKAAFDASGKIYENGWDFVDFVEGLIEHFRNIMTVVLTEKTELIETADVYRDRYLNYFDKFSEGDILRLLNFLNKVHQELRYTQNHKLKVEISLSHLIGLEKSSTLSALISDISNNKNIEASPRQPLIKEPIQYSSPKENSKSIKEELFTKPAEKKILKPEVTAASSFDFEMVKAKWESFVNDVSSERSLIFGPVIKNIKLVNLEGNKLHIHCQENHHKDVLLHNESYLTKKTMQFFGKKLSFFIRENPLADIKSETKEYEKKVVKKDIENYEDPYENIIINELGGEEIK